MDPPRETVKDAMMMRETPLRKRHEAYAAGLRDWAKRGVEAGTITADAALEADVEYLPFGAGDAESGDVCEIVATYGLVEAEYAAIRRGAGLLDLPQRGVIRVTGADRREFLNRMLTQELKDLEAGDARESFWLNRKGRIDADLLVVERGDDLLLDVDRPQLAHTVKSLGDFLFAEDVEITDASDSFHRLALHGKRAMEVMAAMTGRDPFLLAPGASAQATIGGEELTVARRDQTGEHGIDLFFATDDAETVWDAIVTTDETLGEGKRRIRPIGWFAFNIARIEGGTTLMNIDFGPTNLPHETGILRRRVNFTKGCYLGQEVVARMESLGRPKQVLVGLRVKADRLPVAGAQIFPADDPAGSPAGIITSSTLSPMLGSAPIAFAMVKTKHAEAGAELLVNAEGEQVEAAVHGLRFWPGDEAPEGDQPQ